MKRLSSTLFTSLFTSSIAPGMTTKMCAGLVASVIISGASVAYAQQPGGFGGGGLPGAGGAGGPGPTGGPEEEKKEGIAEAAKTAGKLPSVLVLPTPKSNRKRWKLLEVDGYFRLRTDWFKNFNLGFRDDPTVGGAPFPEPLACAREPRISACEDTMSGANMRLRLEPRFNIDEGTAVHMQVDVFDNVVMGSTPNGERLDGVYTSNTGGTLPPVGVLGDSQTPPVRGVNSDRDAIAIKRAWAEVSLPLGILKFGRMPNHWGMGILNNGGGEDPIHGTYDHDADYGDSVDRVSFSAQIPGTDLRGGVASDWSITRLTSNQTAAGVGREGHPFDLDDKDDANQWVFTVSKLDSPQEWKDTVDRGELAYNWGTYFGYRTQDFDNDLTDFKIGGTLGADKYVVRNSTLYIPDLWGRAAYKGHTIEGEATGKFGSLSTTDSQGAARSLDVRMFGAVGRYTLSLVDDKLKLGLEGGYASGDSAANDPRGRTNVSNSPQLGGPGDTKLSRFAFNRDYKIDMILFRHLMGAVSNAAYFKPFVSYQLTNSINGKLQNITAFAPQSAATPGGQRFYGTEFDADISYRNGGFSAGIAYGVYLPFAAMTHPADINQTEVYGDNTNDPGTAHSITSRFMLAF
jgi:uncharacterized protein (TIGR04551 family)